MPPGFEESFSKPVLPWISPIDPNGGYYLEQLPMMLDVEIEDTPGNLRMQMLRSSSHWSLGRKTTESSIHECYLEAIEKSDRFIYIENQFVISSTGSNGVENSVIKALYARICRAVDEGTPFKVIIFLPLMPAFEANLEEKQGKVMQIQIGLENATLGHGEDSLLGKLTQRLKDSGIPPEYYVMICGLRTWDFRPEDNFPTTEIIYIHSKVVLLYAANDRRRLLLNNRKCKHQRQKLARLKRLRSCSFRRRATQQANLHRVRSHDGER